MPSQLQISGVLRYGKAYGEEGDFIEGVADEDGLEELPEEYTIRRNEFILLFPADGIFCIAVLVIVSRIFTGKLANHIMEPLNALADGAEVSGLLECFRGKTAVR